MQHNHDAIIESEGEQALLVLESMHFMENTVVVQYRL